METFYDYVKNINTEEEIKEFRKCCIYLDNLNPYTSTYHITGVLLNKGEKHRIFLTDFDEEGKTIHYEAEMVFNRENGKKLLIVKMGEEEKIWEM